MELSIIVPGRPLLNLNFSYEFAPCDKTTTPPLFPAKLVTSKDTLYCYI